MNKRLVSTLISIGLSAGAASLATAQTVTPPAAGSGHAQQSGRHDHAKRAFSLPGERVEAKLAYLKTALKVTDAQQPQWDAFAATLRKQAADRDERIKTMRARFAERKPHERPNAIARMEHQQQRHAAALTRLNELLAVERPLYASLTVEQKQVADEVLAPQGDRHGGFGRHGPHARA
jgi:hypothetical protein